MKKLLCMAAAMLMFAVPVAAEGNITVFSNGNEVADKGIIIDGRTMVPVRGVFEYMGYTVDWDGETKTATLTSSDKATVITLTGGKTDFTVNDKTITPDVPQQIVDGRFMLPLRAVGEAVDAKVEWDSDTKTAYVADNSAAEETTSLTESSSLTEEETETTTAFTPQTKTETIGNTTITSETTVPFVRIEAVPTEEVPEATDINAE